MKIKACFIVVIFSFACCFVFGQIVESITPVKFGSFEIRSDVKTIRGEHFLFINIFKAGQFVFSDSITTDVANCQGFAFPSNQPFKNYFIFSKHMRHAGKTYILTGDGGFTVIGGGVFWAAPKDKLLFILAEKDYRNLLVFSLNQMKTVFEKFSCDEFTDWYYRKGSYFGKVASECGDELKPEKEVSEWMHPVEIEQFDVKLNTLNELHITDEQVERSQALVKYAFCK